MSEQNRAAYNGKISFVRGSGQEKQEIPATVFFQMTKSEDYRIVDEKRQFKAASDIVILSLNEADNYFKPVTIISPGDLLKNVDHRVGRKITCMGSPSHMTQKKYGNCKGDDFKWKQENTRIFSKDLTRDESGIVTNLAASPGMSGGVCYLAEDSGKIIGISVNGYIKDSKGNLTMPNINFQSTDTSEKNQRHIAPFDVLDKRMKAELGYGLKDLDKHCK